MLQIKALKEKKCFPNFQLEKRSSWWKLVGKKKWNGQRTTEQERRIKKVNGALIMSKVNLNTQMTIRVIK